MTKKGAWVKFRKQPRPYSETEQQKKIREAGQKISEKCTGKKGKEFQICRSDILRKIFEKAS